MFCLSGTTHAQHISVDSKLYNDENGFSLYANVIHKDSRGLFWIGTHFGMYRFDGNEFVLYDESTGLPFNRILEIYEDNEGWFWLYNSCESIFECEKGLVFFHPLTKKVLTFQERFGNQTTIKANQITSIAQDSSNIYFTANKKLLIWSREGKLKEIPFKGVEKTPMLLNKVNDNLIGVYQIDREKGNPNIPNLFDPNIQYLVFDLNGNQIHTPTPISIDGFHADILVHLRRKFSKLAGIKVKNYELSFLEDGRLGIDTLPNALPQGNTNTRPTYAEFDENLYVQDSPEVYYNNLGPFREIEGIKGPVEIFKSTARPELIQVIWVKKKSSNFFHQFYVGRRIRHNLFNETTKSTWIASSKGLSIFQYTPLSFYQPNIKGNRLAYACISLDKDRTYLRTEPKALVYSHKKDTAIILSKKHLDRKRFRIKAFCQEKGDTHFWSVTSTHLLKIDKQNFTVDKYQFPENFEGGNAAIKIGGTIWAGGYKNGIYQYDIKEENFKEFTAFNKFEKLKSSKVHFFLKIDDDIFLIATNTGIYICSIKDGILEHYGKEEKTNYKLPTDNIFHISKAKQNGYWLASSNGLIKWNPKKENNTQKNQSYKIIKELPVKEIFAAYEDDFGFVWMPTSKGLIQFQISSGLYKLYLNESGGSSAAFQKYAHDRSEDGTLIMGSYDGFNIFHPRDFKDVDLSPSVPLIITDFEQHIDSEDKIKDQLEKIVNEKEITIKPGDKFFSIRVAFSDYRNADKHRFAYRIEGYQKDWQEDKSNLIRVSGLPYGNFNLQIKGRLPDGQFASPILSIPIRVIKPIYLQTWFLTTCAVLLLISIFLIFKWRTRRLLERQKELEYSVAQATLTIRQQNEELKNLDKVKSRFFANVSHELRTPLTLILGPLTSMVKSGTLNKRNSTFAELGRKNAKGLLNLVNEILDLTKMESGKLELKEEPIDFHPFLQRIIDAYLGVAQQKRINYNFDYLCTPALRLEVDLKKFEKLVNNLLSNAFKFTPPDGDILVKVIEEGPSLLLSVKDNGRGIHPDDLPHVFDRYYQSSQPDVPKEGGTGIGLSLSLEFAKLMNGSLWAESKLEEGSIFYFRFPKKEESKAIDQQPFLSDQKEIINIASTESLAAPIFNQGLNEKQDIEKWEQQGPFKILLVEDNENLRDYIQLIIGEKYEVSTTENGKIAWEYLATHELPDLIVSDIMMPEMDGYQLLTKLKDDDRFRGTPVIMLTALADLKDKLKALRIGVDDYMLKPFEEEELLARIDNLLRNSWERKLFYQKGVGDTSEEPTGSEKKEAPIKNISSDDSKWLKEVEQIVEKEITSFGFTAAQLADHLAMSKRSLELKLKSITGLTPRKYIQEIRFNQARQLLENGETKSVKMLAYKMGLKDTSHFSKLYKKRFGKSPSEYFEH